MSSWKVHWKGIMVSVILIAVILFGAKMNHSEVRSAEVQYSGEEWEQMENGNWRKPCFQLGVTKGKYQFELVYHTNEDMVWKVLDLNSNDGENRLGRLIAQGELPSDQELMQQEIELSENAEKLTLYVEAADASSLIESWTLKPDAGNYADYEIVFCICVLILLFLVSTWKKRWDLFVVFLISIILILPSVNGYLQRGDDIAFHLDRIRGLAEALQSGQFPARISPAFHKGYGYSVSMMYPELFLYLPAVCYMAGVSLITSYKILVFFIHVMTALAGVYSFEHLLKSETAGTMAAIAYLLNPYRLINIYQRAAVGEALAMIFFPLLIYGIYELFYGNTRKWWIVPAAATGVLQSHIISTELCVIFCVLAAIPFFILVWKEKKNCRLFEIGKAVIVTIGLNVWFLIPFLQRIKEGGIFQKGTYDLQSYAVDIWNLFRYEIRLEGRYDIDGITHWDFISVGIVSLIAICVFVYYAYGKKLLSKNQEQIGTVCLSFGVLSCYMATRIFPWGFMQEYFPKIYDIIGRIQFPWRMCGYAAVFFAVVTGIAMAELIRDRKTMIAIAMLAIAGATAVSCMDQYTNKNIYISSRSVLTSSPNSDYYAMDTIENTMLDQGDTIVSEPSIAISEYERNGMNLSFQYDGTFDNCRLRLPIYNYGMHKIYVNGTEYKINESENNQIVLNIDGAQQSGKIEVLYVEPLLYKAGNMISLIFAAGWVTIWLWNKKRTGENTKNVIDHCTML